ncbi:MAG: ABCB family ABC transporter ATP-binding protein/permease [Polymorphobacter sp.]|uniref:ABCB family ABC transporter ATP-binding protein/permease n=1 Tax=Polymorphobacter sp. TaxID=1909290 RepID=UPI003A85C59C
MRAFDTPSPPPPSGKADLAMLRRFLPYLWPAGHFDLKARIVFAVVLVLAAKSTLLVMPFAFGGIVDAMSEASTADNTAAASLALALVGAYALARFSAVLFDNLRNAVFERVGQEAARKLALDVFTHIHQLSLRFHLSRRTGSLTRIIERGTKSIDSMLYFLLFNIAPTAFELTAVSIIFWVKLGPAMMFAVLGMMLAYVGFTQRVTAWRTQLRRDMVESDQNATGRAVDSLLNYETVKYFNAEEHERENYGRAIARYARAATKSGASLAWLNVGQSLITNLMLAAAMAFTVEGWASGKFTPGDVVLINTLLIQLFRPLDLLGFVYREIKQGLIDMENMFALIDTPAEITDASGAPPLRVTGGSITFEHVRFAYESDREILHGISFHVPAGGSVAVVGHSGAGKSTLSRILYRFYDISEGRVLIDDQDLRHVAQSSVRAQIGIVPQDTVLFNDSIAYNIAYGAPGASREEIEAAARGASIHDFITSLPQGYETQVGERGLKLSGGEKQRVAIARTLLKNPPILILDEATSALDSATEAEIQTALRTVSKNRTTLTIAHRLSTITTAQEILVMDAGRIIERGTHDQLLAKGGRYAEMWAMQAAEQRDPAIAAE